jgi:hypothetical protein
VDYERLERVPINNDRLEIFEKKQVQIPSFTFRFNR